MPRKGRCCPFFRGALGVRYLRCREGGETAQLLAGALGYFRYCARGKSCPIVRGPLGVCKGKCCSMFRRALGVSSIPRKGKCCPIFRGALRVFSIPRKGQCCPILSRGSWGIFDTAEGKCCPIFRGALGVFSIPRNGALPIFSRDSWGVPAGANMFSIPCKGQCCQVFRGTPGECPQEHSCSTPRRGKGCPCVRGAPGREPAGSCMFDTAQEEMVPNLSVASWGRAGRRVYFRYRARGNVAYLFDTAHGEMYLRYRAECPCIRASVQAVMLHNFSWVVGEFPQEHLCSIPIP
jgi:hypothetical protein